MDCPCCVGKKCAMHYFGLNEDCECICNDRKLKEFARAVEDFVVRHGAHDGPCTNEGNESEDACELHLETSEKRRKVVQDMLPEVKRILWEENPE